MRRLEPEIETADRAAASSASTSLFQPVRDVQRNRAEAREESTMFQDHVADPETVALPQLVGRLADEIGQMTAMAGTLQVAVRVDDSFDVEDGDRLRSAQNLDLLTQTLGALHCFVQTLRDMVPLDHHVDARRATRDVKLASVRERLSSGRVAHAVPAELDLF